MAWCDASATSCSRWARKNGSAPTRSAPARSSTRVDEGGVDLPFGAGFENTELYSLGVQRLLRVLHDALGVRIVWVHEQRDQTGLRNKPFKGGRAVVGKGADQLPIVVSVIWKSIGLDHRPVCQVLEKQVRRVNDSVLFLSSRAAAQCNIAAARDRVTADIALSLDQDHRGTSFPRDYCRGKSGCS